jgi:hypothetical protein
LKKIWSQISTLDIRSLVKPPNSLLARFKSFFTW